MAKVMTMVSYMKSETVKEMLKQMLKANHMCCCALDGSFICRNCSMVDDMKERRDWACPNCQGMY